MSKKAVMILVFLISFSIIGCVGSDIKSDKESTIIKPTQTVKTGCFYTFDWFSIDNIGYQEAPFGYKYAVVTLKIDNTLGKELVSTSGIYWKFVGENGIIYDYDSATYSDIIAHQNVDVSKGYSYQTKIVYLIDNDVNSGKLIPEFWNIANPILDTNLLIEHPEIEPESTINPNIREEIIIPTDYSDEEKFEYWFDGTGRYYRSIVSQTIYRDLEFVNEYAVKDLEQIEEFKLSGKHIELRNKYKEFLELLIEMDESNYECLYDDMCDGYFESELRKVWSNCKIIRSTI